MGNGTVEKCEQYRRHVDFIKDYRKAVNAASGSKFDANANVENKNVTTCAGEIFKQDAIGVHRLLMIDKLKEMFGDECAEEYIRQINNHEIYVHDETNPALSYCASITMYPYLFKGLKNICGSSESPKNLDSFAGSFVNLVFAVASQFAGAVSTPEFLIYLDYFMRREFGEDYYKHINKVVTLSTKPKTIRDKLDGILQQVVYSINQPAAARNFQSVFWNIAYFDRPYFEGMFSEFVFPDGTSPTWNSLNWLQKYFMRWFNKERLREPLTFPVETVNLLDDGTDYVDQEWKDWTAQMWSEGHSFFLYRSDSVDSLSSCCRLRNEIQNNTFSFTLGAGGVATGSKAVITININRLVQNAVRDGASISDRVSEQVAKVHMYLLARNEIIKDNLEAGMMPIYDAGYIAMEKQYLTIGINGFVEGAEFLGIDISPNENYFKYGEAILKPIFTLNRAAKTDDIMFNTEFVPAENLGVKNAKWDKEDGYASPRDCYNSYFYRSEDEGTSIIDKFMLHGERLTRYLDGGSALHANLDEHLSKEQYLNMMMVMLKTGCSYATFNIPNTICNQCDYISKHKLSKCPSCGSDDLDYATRIIGYLKRVSRWSEERKKEEGRRHYAHIL